MAWNTQRLVGGVQVGNWLAGRGRVLIVFVLEASERGTPKDGTAKCKLVQETAERADRDHAGIDVSSMEEDYVCKK